MTPGIQLDRNAFGRLVFTDATGETYENVVPVRAFPITAPDAGFSLVDLEGKELAWVDSIDALCNDARELVLQTFAAREFMPVIEKIVGVSSFLTPSVWKVETDRGKTQLILAGEENIRRLAPPALLVTDSHGIHYLIRDRGALDKQSKKYLDRFL
ncbi:MAG: DUF1854 domain-containing protein [Candidatus Accumulibacter sp.]|jgi:hypothetical protein|nr:DUF1854 domain-containing protein [Accumulibacter sp.]